MTSGQVASITSSPRSPARLTSTALATPCALNTVDRARRDLVDVVDEARALALQRLDHVLVVDDLVAHVDRRPEAAQRPLDDLDRPLDAGAEAARLGEDDAQRGPGHPASPPGGRDHAPASPRLTLGGCARRESLIYEFCDGE